MTNSQTGETERPLQEWKYSYVAGIVDFNSSLTVSIQEMSDRKVGYGIIPKLRVTNPHRGSIEFLREFCEEHDISPRVGPRNNTFRLEVTKRNELRKFTSLIQPYLIARYESVEILRTRLLPGLEHGVGSTKKGFIRLVRYADRIRERTSSAGSKYDESYFKDEWDIQ